MKLIKRILACVVAIAVMLTSAMTVMAAGSISKDATADGYKVVVVTEETDIYKELKEIYPILAQAILDVNEGKITMKEFIEKIKEEAENITDGTTKESMLDVASKLEKKMFVTAFYTLIPAETTEKNAHNQYDVPLNVKNLTKELTGIEALSYNSEKKTLEIIEIPEEDIDVDNHIINIKMDDTSLLAIIADDLEAK
jgi:hypothetical protein